jgi:adenosylcobinamide-GDP ribazoletransferase
MTTKKSEFLKGLITALQTLTILPVPGRGADRMGDALRWFPLVGFLLGLLVVLAGRLTLWVGGGWNYAAGFVMLSASILLTRALHLDGISDWADGFWGAFDRQRVLAIMKDSNLGTFGTVALVWVLLGKWIALSRLAGHDGWGWIIGAFIISRTMQVVLAAAHPYARPEEGTGSPFVSQATVSIATWALIEAAILLTVVCWLSWPLVLAGAWGVTRIFGIWCNRRVGGVTGDLLGACSEITELLTLFAGAILVGT